MTLTMEKRQTSVVVARGDALTATNANELEQEIELALEEHGDVVLDLSQVDFIDSAGCGTLLHLKKLASEYEARVILCSITRTVRALFELIRMGRVFEIHSDRESAMLALS